MLCALAFGIEIMATTVINRVIPGLYSITNDDGTISVLDKLDFLFYPVIGLFITVVAITRWKWRGIYVIPANALGYYIAARFICDSTVIGVKDVILTIISNCACIIIMLWFSKIKTKELYDDGNKTSLMLLAIIGINIVSIVIFTLIINIVSGIPFATAISSVAPTTLSAVLMHLFAYVILFLGVFVFRSMGLLVDAKQKLLDMKKDRDNEAKYYLNLGSNVPSEEQQNETKQ